ncbi:hypothetical protein [Streptomyces sp. NPDC127084]|uniref:hypothetical protein n=1 Tax=Streptomyces sp. NPDC127084 TaxID=3347133 RepID=UPI003658FDA4
MSVDRAGTRVPEAGNFAAQPFSNQLIDDALQFVRARLARHLTESPTTDEERMASVLAHQADIAAEQTRINLRAVGLAEAETSWRTLAGIARMWADHDDYQQDFGRMYAEFPAPLATHALVRARPGECDCEEDVALHRNVLVPLTEWDLPRWRLLRDERRLVPSTLYEPLRDAGSAQVWYLISARRARRRRPRT